MSKIDVVVPCYNYGRYLGDCVSSILTQSVSDLRVLIIDDCSTDGSAAKGRELCRADRRVTLVKHDRNRGHIATYNEGIDWAEAEYFLLLSADDLLLPGALERAVRIMDRDPTIVLSHGVALPWQVGSPRPVADAAASLAWRRQNLVDIMCETGRNFIFTATAVVRTAAQKRVGGYRTSLPHTGDMEMWLRLALHGAVAGINSPAQAIYRRHASNMSCAFLGRKLSDLQGRIDAFDCFFAEASPALPNEAALKRQASGALAREAYWAAVARGSRGQFAEAVGLFAFAFELLPRLRFLPPFGQLRRIGAFKEGAAALNPGRAGKTLGQC